MMRDKLKKLWGGLVTFNLTLVLTLNLFLIIGTVLALTGAAVWAADALGLVSWEALLTPAAVMVVMYATCILIGISEVVMIELVLLKPMRRMVAAMKRLAEGDFSARMRCEGHVRPAELRAFAAAFNTAAQELGGTELLRKDFVNNFSHEFKTPITSLGGFADLLLECGDELPPAEQREYLGIISSEAHRLASLASNVLALSRLEAQTILADTAAFNLGEQLRQTALMMEQKWTDRRIKLCMQVEDCRCTGSEELLKQVWMNLLDNAVKFSPVGGRVTVALRRDEAAQAVEVSVRDEGPGMDAATQAHIFDQFYQGDTSHKTEGSGLGLAMVKKIVALHGGRVTVESEPGQGALFTVRLPQPAPLPA